MFKKFIKWLRDGQTSINVCWECGYDNCENYTSVCENCGNDL